MVTFHNRRFARPVKGFYLPGSLKTHLVTDRGTVASVLAGLFIPPNLPVGTKPMRSRQTGMVAKKRDA
jgi:hypothetical protein